MLEIASSSQLDTDLMEDLLPPVAADTGRQGRFIERSQGMMEMHWTTSRHDGSYYSNDKGGDNDGGDDEEEDRDKDEDEEDEDEDEDEEDEDKDKDKDEPPFYDSEIPGISNWDLLGKDFEHEATALGLYSSYELPTQANKSLDGKSLGESDLKLLLRYTLKVEDHLSDHTFS